MTKKDFKNIKVIGFDLDHTLYPKNERMNKFIQDYICGKIALLKEISFEEARNLWDEKYKELGSGSKTLKALGVENGSDIVQKSIEQPKVIDHISPDPKTVGFLEKIIVRYEIDLITGSSTELAKEKLKKIGISPEIFKHIIGGDVEKTNGDAFIKWMDFYPELEPENFLYIGDRIKTDALPVIKLGAKAIIVNTDGVDEKENILQLKTIFEIGKYI